MSSADTPAPAQLGGRIPLLAQDDLADEQKEIYQRLRANQVPWAASHGFRGMTDDGRLIGPPLLSVSGVPSTPAGRKGGSSPMPGALTDPAAAAAVGMATTRQLNATLYRHFPVRSDLLAGACADEVAALCQQGAALPGALGTTMPASGRRWGPG